MSGQAACAAAAQLSEGILPLPRQTFLSLEASLSPFVHCLILILKSKEKAADLGQP